MSLRPSPASWFEVLVLRDDLTAAIDALARSSKVELQSHGESRTPLLMPECREMLVEFDELRHRYDRYWPEACRHEADERLEPQQMLDDAMRRLRDWASAAHDVVQRIEALSGQEADLRIILPLLHEGQPSLDLSRFVDAGPLLRSRIFLMPGDAWPKALPGDVITRRAVTPGRHYVLAVGMPDHIAALEHQLALEKARPIAMPENTMNE